MRSVLLGTVVVALAAGTAACTAFGAEGSEAQPPPRAVDAGVATDDEPVSGPDTPAQPASGGDAGVLLPSVDTRVGCPAVAGAPTLLFCSDFDRDPAYAGWELVDDGGSGLYGTSTEHVSSPRSARLETRAGGGSPDVRLRRPMGKGRRISLAGSVRVQRADKQPLAQVVRLVMLNGTGSVFLRSDGALVEARKTANGVESFVRPPMTSLVVDRWIAFRLTVDFASLTASADLDGIASDLNIAAAKKDANVDAVLGVAEPRQADDGWVVLFDNVTGFRAP